MTLWIRFDIVLVHIKLIIASLLTLACLKSKCLLLKILTVLYTAIIMDITRSYYSNSEKAIPESLGIWGYSLKQVFALFHPLLTVRLMQHIGYALPISLFSCWAYCVLLGTHDTHGCGPLAKRKREQFLHKWYFKITKLLYEPRLECKRKEKNLNCYCEPLCTSVID